MKKILDFKSISIAGLVTASLLYYLNLIFSKGSFTVDSKFLFSAYAIMVLWCLVYMIIHIRKLNKTVDRLTRMNEDMRQVNKDMKQMLETIVENQLENKIVAEKLHRNTRVLLLEAIAEGGSNGGNKKRIKVVGRK